jgi:iron complex transport system ATP-binding protein
MLRIHELNFRYKNINALEGVGLKLNKGEILSIVGPNGAGKTTLLKCIVRIVKPERGTILSSPSKFPITVFDAVLMGRRPYITWKPSKKDLEVVADLLMSMDLEDLALRGFDELSGGEKQKVLLARAFAQDPNYLLFDEPTSNLDLRHQMEVMEMISGMVREKGVAAILAMHDLNLASRFSDRILMLNAGKIFCNGEPLQVMTVENIRSVYGVEVTINLSDGHPYIVPIRQVKWISLGSDTIIMRVKGILKNLTAIKYGMRADLML